MKADKLLRQNALFIASTTLFLTHQFVEPFYKNTLIDSYLDDILFFPVVYGFCLLVFKLLLGQNFTLPLLWALSGFVLTVVSTEFIFPNFSNKHTKDLNDVIAYAIGFMLFWFFGNATFNRPKI